MVLAFAGMSRRDIAIALRLDIKTVAKHFGRELEGGPLIIRQQLLAALETAAAQGTKSARRLLAKAKRARSQTRLIPGSARSLSFSTAALGRRDNAIGIKPTAKQRKQVMLCVAMKMRPTEIANVFRIDQDTLVKHFSRELTLGPTIMRRWFFAVITRQAIKGKKRSIALLAKMWADQPAGGSSRMP
jgi:hypothetical protein